MLTWSNVLAFDSDGSLAPIVQDPDKARMRASTRGLLGKVTPRPPFIAVTGRAQAKARRLRELRPRESPS